MDAGTPCLEPSVLFVPTPFALVSPRMSADSNRQPGSDATRLTLPTGPRDWAG